MEQSSYIDIRRISKGLRSSTAGKDSFDRAFGTHPRAIPGRRRSVVWRFKRVVVISVWGRAPCTLYGNTKESNRRVILVSFAYMWGASSISSILDPDCARLSPLDGQTTCMCASNGSVPHLKKIERSVRS